MRATWSGCERILAVTVKHVEAFENRVAFRSVAPDRLPVVGKIADNVYGAFAYGSRGLVWAALAAELLASELEGEPLPLEGKLADALRRCASRSARLGAPQDRRARVLDVAQAAQRHA